MNRPPPLVPKSVRAGFSLVEVCVALGIIAFALVAILGLMGVGINASRSSIDETTVSFVAQDVFSRVKSEVSTVNALVPVSQLTLNWSGNAVSNGLSYAALAADTTSGTASAPVATSYYDRNGSFLVPDRSNGGFVQENGITPQPLYQAAVFIHPPLAGANPPGAGTPPPYNQSATGGAALPALLAVTVQVGWPTDAAGNVPKAQAAKSVYTFYLPKP